MGTIKKQKLALRPETSLANVGNQISITNKILKSIKDVQINVFGTFTDPRDGNVYKTVKIGTQVWMAENLRYIPHVCPVKEEGGIWVYDYDGHDIEQAKSTDNYKNYGCLYVWETAIKVCPSGWHLPTDEEWKKLEMHLGMTQIEADEGGWRGTDQGTRLKNTNGWNSGEYGTNTSGFSALPGGFRYYLGTFQFIGYYGYWWSSSVFDAGSAWYRSLGYGSGSGGVCRSLDARRSGFSIRCLGDFK